MVGCGSPITRPDPILPLSRGLRGGGWEGVAPSKTGPPRDDGFLASKNRDAAQHAVRAICQGVSPLRAHPELGRLVDGPAAINGVMSFRIRDGQQPLTATEQEISVQAMRREGSLTPCCNADRYGTDITVIGDGQPQLYGFIKMLAGGMQ